MPQIRKMLAGSAAQPLPIVDAAGLDEAAAQSGIDCDISPDTLAMLQYTSGSTGSPRGVMITHGNLIRNQRMIAECFGHGEDTRVVTWLPMYHDMGLIGTALQPLFLGVPCTLMSPVDFLRKPVRWLRAISESRATTSGGPNFAYDYCVRKITREACEGLDLSCWKVAFNGSEPVRSATIDRFADKFAEFGFRRRAMLPCYGLAEATLIVCGKRHDRSPRVESLTVPTGARLQGADAAAAAADNGGSFVSCGSPIGDMQVCVVSPESRTACRDGETGEIWIRGGTVAGGYWRDEAATREALKTHPPGTTDHPFLRTGDLGFVLDGELFVTGRLRDVITCAAANTIRTIWKRPCSALIRH